MNDYHCQKCGYMLWVRRVRLIEGFCVRCLSREMLPKASSDDCESWESFNKREEVYRLKETHRKEDMIVNAAAILLFIFILLLVCLYML